MWANAQRDDRPAEYRWRPLFNVAKFGGPMTDDRITRIILCVIRASRGKIGEF